MADMIPEQLDRLEGLLAAARLGTMIADTHHQRDYAGRSHGFLRTAGEMVPVAGFVLAVEGMEQHEGCARLQLVAEAVNALPSLIASLKAAREALEDFCLSAECAAGCDEGVSPDTASSEIMSAMGSAMSVSYDRARQSLEGNPHVG